MSKMMLLFMKYISEARDGFVPAPLSHILY